MNTYDIAKYERLQMQAYTLGVQVRAMAEDRNAELDLMRSLQMRAGRYDYGQTPQHNLDAWPDAAEAARAGVSLSALQGIVACSERIARIQQVTDALHARLGPARQLANACRQFLIDRGAIGSDVLRMQGIQS